MAVSVLYLPNNKNTVTEEGTNLLHAAAEAGVLIDGSCAGKGLCGKCKVIILEGDAGNLNSLEEHALSDKEKEEGYRLACQITVNTDLVVMIPDIHGSSQRKKRMNKLPDSFVPNITIQKRFIKVPKAVIETQINDIDRIREAASCPDMKFDHVLLPDIQKAITAKRGKLTVVLSDDHLIAIEADDTSSQCYGLAFDIGTTTVVGILWDLIEKKMADVEAATNPQSVFGSDVISRIQYCIEEVSHTKEMQKKIVECFNEMIRKFCERNGIKNNHIYDMTVVGNTTMSHLFLGVNPVSMSRVPFAPVYCEGIHLKAGQLGIGVNANANVYTLPNIAGHVGSDITGVMLATNVFGLPGNTIIIDVGTNGEILVAKNGTVEACSTAAGPAFEGACIHHGMRAAKGAIEGITINEDISLKVIEDGEPSGICGSGLIDAIGELIKAGLINKRGNLLTQDEARNKGIAPAICDRLFGKGKDTGIVLFRSAGKDSIVLLQQDIREVQLAKGAILGGMMTLMKNLDFTVDQIDRVIVAGAFGSYINKESAIRMGLLPSISPDKVISIGNGAGVGASMALLSINCREQAELLTKQIRHVELSKNDDFQDYYIDSMLFANACE